MTRQLRHYAVGDSLIVTVGPTAASSLLGSLREQLATRGPQWSRVVLLASGRDDVGPAELQDLAGRFRARSEDILIGYDDATIVGGRDDRVPGTVTRAFLQITHCPLILPRARASLTTVAEAFDDLYSLDGPIGYSPAYLPFHGARVSEIHLLDPGIVPPLAGDERGMSVLIRVRRSRPLDFYNELWRQYCCSLTPSVDFSMGARLVSDAAPETAKVLVFRDAAHRAPLKRIHRKGTICQ